MGNTYHARGRLVDGFAVREHPLYMTWVNMKSRCNVNTDQNKNYSGRGITYCPRWEHFENFAADMGSKPSSSHSLERVDNNGNYGPENCVWATGTQQCLNRRLFRNNRTGFTGVVKKGSRYVVQFNYKNRVFKPGTSYATPEEAYFSYVELRHMVLSGCPTDHITSRHARFDNVTAIRGISKRSDGYIVRVTKDKIRIYLGFYKTLEDAKMRLEQWKKENS